LVNQNFDVINLNLYIKNIPLLVIGKSKFRRYQFEAIYQKYTHFSYLVNQHFKGKQVDSIYPKIPLLVFW